MDTPNLDTLMRVAAFERVRELNEIHDFHLVTWVVDADIEAPPAVTNE
jgi:hypothetical protein